MKKILSIIVCLFVLTCFEINSFALADQLSASSNTPVQRLNEVKFISGEIQDEIQIIVKSYNGYAVTRLASPDRIAIDIPNVSVSAAKQLAGAKSGRVKAVRFAPFGNNSARIVIDTAGVQQYRIYEKDGRLSVYIIDSIADSITYLNTGDEAGLAISNAELIQSGSGEEEPYTEKYEPESGKYILTFSGGAAKLQNKTVKINDSLIDSMQFVNNIYTKQISIVFTAKQKLSFKVSLKEGSKGTEINISKFKDAIVNEPENVPDQEEDRELCNLSVEYAGNDGADEVSILTDNYSGYSIMRLSGPDRIVIDIPYAIAPQNQQSIDVESKLIKAVRYAQFENNIGRIVIDTAGQPQYQAEEKEGRLTVSVQTPEYKNITYSATGDRVCFILPKIHLTEGGQDLKKFYSESYDETGMKYTITFPSSLGDIGSGTFKVNSGFIDYVDIIKNNEDQTTAITFNAKEQLVYNIITRQLNSAVDDTTITVLKPFSAEDRLIVIDPGHGGADPGAVHGALTEKSLNIDIAKRLNSLLKSRGVNTYMTRDDDTYIGLYERSYIANKLNATLFLSIHNNSYNVSAKGTETLYFPSKAGFGKRFAQIIQDSLTSSLGTFDRKIKERPGLVVLKATSMPAALAEIAFITNPDDAQKLKSDEFIQKAAEALCEAVVKALEEAP